MIVESNFYLFFIRFTVIRTSELMVMLVFGFTIFGAVKGELAAAYEFKLFI